MKIMQDHEIDQIYQPHANRQQRHQADHNNHAEQNPSGIDINQALHANRNRPHVNTHETNHQRTQQLTRAQREWQALFSGSDETEDVRVSDGNRPIQLSIENQRANVHWGDELGEKPDTSTRIYVLNVHGLSLDRRGGRFDDCAKL